MLTIDNPTAMREWALLQHHERKTVGFVPTMGALHEGHRALIEKAKSMSDVVVVSLFVNPLQFNVLSDFEKYPRPVEADIRICESISVDVVYAPTYDAMYPHGFETKVVPGSLSLPMEGTSRPGHFEGVTTVVTKLFNAVQPTYAVFGEKDYQQLVILQSIVRDLDMSVQIIAVPTVREPDGLALSSRNLRLSSAARATAVVIPQALAIANELFTAGERNPEHLISAVKHHLESAPSAVVDYVEIADAITLTPVTKIMSKVVLAVAVFFDDVRLIDNITLQSH